ncbi:MAG: hypothetical protein WCW26_01700 [Candidatus Buchananbacteria bacterium]
MDLKKIFILAIFLFFAGFFASPVLGATVISPLLELEVEPGQTQKGLVKIYNETEKDLVLKSSIEPFAAGDEFGKPKYLAADNQAFLNWFTVSVDLVTLKPHQAMRVPFEVKVPVNATPGGYYVVIFWQTQNESSKENPNVNINSKVGTLILLKVSGEFREIGEVTEFKTQPEKKCFFGLPINFLVRFVNDGNVHLAPSGQIKLKNWFGADKILPVNESKNNVLPGSARRFEVVWGQTKQGNFWQNFWRGLSFEANSLAFGKYTAELELNYGTPAQTVNYPLSFWLIPWRLILIFILFIFIVLIFSKINSKIKKIKNSKKSF